MRGLKVRDVKTSAWVWFAAFAVVVVGPTTAVGQTGPGEGREGLVELSKQDPRLKGHYAPAGFKVRIIATEPAIIDPTAMAFDDKGTLYVAEWKHADHMFDTTEQLKLPEGGTTKVMRRRKATTDIVKRLTDRDGDGVYETAEVVVDGAEMPSSIFPWKNSLYLTCVGRLERWSDDDGDGRFETKTILADGFCGFYHHWLSGMNLNADGWFYLTAGDNDNHVIGSDGSRVEVSRCGAVFRGRVDGSQMHLFAMGFRNPYRDLAFNATFDPFVVDNDNEDGSKFQGVRLINPVEDGDYGWRLLPGAPCCQPDFNRGAVDGELPGKLPIIAKTGRGAPAGLVVYNGVALPEAYRNTIIYADVFRKLVRGYRVQPSGGANVLESQYTLMTADDDWFRPCQTVVGADGAMYVLDWRSNSGGAGRLWGDGKYGRIYQLTWAGDGKTPALPTKPNNWNRVESASDAGLFAMIRGADLGEARRALRTLVAHGAKNRDGLLQLARDAAQPEHARLMGLQGARQLWDDEVGATMIALLDDKDPVIRRLAAQALDWDAPHEMKAAVGPLTKHLDDPDGRVARDAALSLARHGAAHADATVKALFAWLTSHPKEDVVTRDGFIRALERLGKDGVEIVADAIREGTADQRREAVNIFIAMRSKEAAQVLPSLATQAGLTGAERLALVRQYKDIPLNIALSTESLAAWVAAHKDVEPAVKAATLEVCRLAGNPAHALVTALLDDVDESVRLAATELAGQSRPAGSMEKLASRLSERGRSLRERVATAHALRGGGGRAATALARAFQAAGDEPAFQKEALRSLAEADRAVANPLAEAALKSKARALRSEAIQVLGETPQSALTLGKAYEAGVIGAADRPAVLAALRKYNSKEHAELARTIEAAADKNMIKADELKKLVATADAWRGLRLFLREDSGARCYTCHKIENVGAMTGPALTGAYQALSIDKVIESVLDPSKEIKEGYEAYKAALKDGRVLSGIKVAQDANTLVLRDANGQETRLKMSDVEELGRDKVSLMPAGLFRDYAPAEAADVVAFLLSKPAQETLRNTARIEHFVAVGPFASGTDRADVPLEKIDAAATFRGLDGHTLSWTRLDASSAGAINMRGQAGLGAGRVYLATRLKSPVAQDASLRFGIDAAAHVYLNGKPVGAIASKGRVHKDAALVRLPLQAGWNTLVFAVDRTDVNERPEGTFELGAPTTIEVAAGGQ